METIIICSVVVYLCVMSLIAIALTCYDKYAAKSRPGHRVRERTLLIVSASGGSAAMLVAMLLVRHKTKHLKFMIGIPVIMVIQVCLAVGCIHLLQLYPIF